MNDHAAKLSALIIASASSFLTPFMISSLNIALPAIGKEFKSDAVMLSWVATSYLLAAAVSLVPFGKLADIHGRKRIFLSGQIIVTITSLLAAISVSAPMLIAFRVFQGIGGAMVFATGIAILTSVYPPPGARQGFRHRRGRCLYRSFLRAVFRRLADLAFFLEEHIFVQYSPGLVHHFTGGVEAKR